MHKMCHGFVHIYVCTVYTHMQYGVWRMVNSFLELIPDAWHMDCPAGSIMALDRITSVTQARISIGSSVSSLIMIPDEK